MLPRTIQSYTGYYYPKMSVLLNGSDGVEIINHSDGGRTFTLSALPQRFYLTAQADNQNGILNCESGLNLYPYCNCSFLCLMRGDNDLEMVSTFQLVLTCEFPVSVGG